MSLKLRPLGVPASEPLPPSPFERGRLINWDDFESASAKYHPSTTGAGSTVARSTTNPMFGDFSLKMVTGGGLNDTCSIQYVESSFNAGRIGAYIGFALQGTKSSITCDLTYRTGSMRYQAILKYDSSATKLYYYGDDGAYHEIDTVEYFTGFAGQIIPYNMMGLLVDLKNGTYSKALFSGVEFDLSSYNLYSASSSVERGLISAWAVSATVAVAQTVYFDRYRLMEGEPA